MRSDALETSRRVYDRLVKMSSAEPPAVRAWEGTTWGPQDPRTTLVLQHPGALRALLLPPTDLTAGEAYLYGDVDVEGDLIGLMHFAAGVEGLRRTSPGSMALFRDLRRLPAGHRRADPDRPKLAGRLHSLRRDKRAVSHHYDTGNDFFALFLGESMAYSSAAFLDPAESLDVAQRRKLDVICRKLQLNPGTRFLDVGCGWGTLLVHAAATYGARGTGVTLSHEQAEDARRRVREAGLADRVDILEADYRDVKGEFDAIASIGMFEHVGRKGLGRYFARLRKMLAPGGLLLNHGITTRDGDSRRRRPTFVSTYVFPDGELEPIAEVVREAEGAGFELRDLESLRASYAITLGHWVANLERAQEAAVDAVGERVYRIWRTYMAGTSAAFDRSAISVYQLVLADPSRPWTFGRRRLLASDDV